MERLAEFKEFVREHPGLKSAVRSGKTTWQAIYEEWYLFGPDDKQWAVFKADQWTGQFEWESGEFGGPSMARGAPEGTSGINGNQASAGNNQNGSRIEIGKATELLGQAYEFLQTVDIDKLQKSMGTFQQFIQLFQSFQNSRGANGTSSPPNSNASGGRPRFSGYFAQFDD